MTRRYLVVGPPGVGKGTQADLIAAEFLIPHISTGVMLREHVARGTDLGTKAKAIMDAGDLVPDDLVVAMLAERIERDDAREGFILDGFPRNIAQANALDDLLPEGLDRVIALSVSDEEVLLRITGRRSCANGHVYHVTDNPPKVDGICDVDGRELFQRSDDTEEVVANRLAVYRASTAPLLDYYADIVVDVEGIGTVEEVWLRVFEGISS
ncbi:MAG: adenylate kinase [Acidimicrobiia bacterium]